jgi:hypothetical protein
MAKNLLSGSCSLYYLHKITKLTLINYTWQECTTFYGASNRVRIFVAAFQVHEIIALEVQKVQLQTAKNFHIITYNF